MTVRLPYLLIDRSVWWILIGSDLLRLSHWMCAIWCLWWSWKLEMVRAWACRKTPNLCQRRWAQLGNSASPILFHPKLLSAQSQLLISSSMRNRCHWQHGARILDIAQMFAQLSCVPYSQSNPGTATNSALSPLIFDNDHSATGRGQGWFLLQRPDPGIRAVRGDTESFESVGR